MNAPEVRWKPDGDDAGVYVYVPQHGSWRRVDLPYGGTGRAELPDGTIPLVPAERCTCVIVSSPELRVLNRQCPVHREAGS